VFPIDTAKVILEVGVDDRVLSSEISFSILLAKFTENVICGILNGFLDECIVGCRMSLCDEVTQGFDSAERNCQFD
jgi:hypothetical protein